MHSSPTRLLHAQGSLRRYTSEAGEHAHEHAQVLVGLSGCLELELGGHGAFVDASCGLVIPAGLPHRYLAALPARVIVIDSPERRGLERVRRFAADARWQFLVDGFDAEAALDDIASSPRQASRRQLDLAALDAAIEAQLHADLPTARLAALCCLSPQRFHARLVETTGLTPQAYLRSRRLDEASKLLRSGLSLEAAALQVGYRTASALAFALRRERGVGARHLRSQ